MIALITLIVLDYISGIIAINVIGEGYILKNVTVVVQRLKFCVSITNVIYFLCNAVRPYVSVIDIFLGNSGAKLLIEYFGIPVIPFFVL